LLDPLHNMTHRLRSVGVPPLQSGPGPSAGTSTSSLVNTAIPAVVFNSGPANTGRGSAALVNFEASRYAWASNAYPTAPPDSTGQSVTAAAVLIDAVTDSGRITGGWTVEQTPAFQPSSDEGPLSVYRRQARNAGGNSSSPVVPTDHWFLINSVPWQVNATVMLEPGAGTSYTSVGDAVSAVPVALLQGGLGFAVTVAGRDAVWVRAVIAL
jgi:hypothetical protein